MSKELTALSRKLRAECPDVAHKMRYHLAGSFLSVRVEDPAGSLTVKEMTCIVKKAGKIAWDADYVTETTPLSGFLYMMEGCVASWRLR